MKNLHAMLGVALMLATLASLTLKPALASGSLTVDHSTISAGGSVVITQSETNTGTVKSFVVTEPDGSVCVATGGPVSNGHPVSRTYPSEFKPLDNVGTCDTSSAGTFEAETSVVIKATNDRDDDDKGNAGSDQIIESISVDNGNKDNGKASDGNKGNDNNQGNDNGQGVKGNGDNGNKGDDECGTDSGGKDKASAQWSDNNGGECKVVHKASFEITFFVLPEVPLGTIGLVGASLASLAGFLYLKKPF